MKEETMGFSSRATLVASLLFLAALPAIAEQGIQDPWREAYFDAFKDKRVVFLPVAMGFDLAEAWAASMRKQAEQLGYKFEIRDPNWKTDVGAQALTQIIAEKPDIIIAHNPDVQAYARLLQRAQQAGIYVLQVNMASSFPTDGYVGPDFVGLGELQGKELVKRCSPKNGGSGKIAVTQGPLTAAPSAYEMKGLANILEQHPEMTVVSNQAADWDASKARAITATVLQQNPDLCAVVGFWDGMDTGSSAAVSEAGKQGKVLVATSGAAERSACDNIKKGVFDIYVGFNAAGQGRDLNDLIRVVLQSKLKPGQLHATLYTPLKVMTDNFKPSDCYDLADLK
jgi:ribose transport system substrate-binding protein